MSKNALFEKWCERACGYIYYPPDRAEVEQELMWHLEDTAEGFVEGGMDADEAEAKALEAVGSPDDVGRLLRRVHKPWLGWACMVMAVVTVVIGLCFPWLMLSWGGFEELGEEVKYLLRGEADFEYVNEMYFSDNLELIRELEGSGSVKCGDYEFRVSRAWLTRWPFYDGETLVFVLDYSSPRFWLGQPKGMHNYLAARDSEGEKYPPRSGLYDISVDGNYYEKIDELSRSVHQSCFAAGEFICYLRLRSDAKWVDIVYDHGEGFDIRIYLEEGGGA